MELSSYRERAGRYLAERAEELYAHLAGCKPTLDLAPIYERHAATLFGDEVVAELLTTLHGSDGGGGRSLRWLARFSVEHNLARRVQSLDEQLAVAAHRADVATLELKLANTEERRGRQDAYERLQNAMQGIHTLRSQRLAVYEEGGRGLTGRSLASLFGELGGVPFALLSDQLERFLAASRDYYYSHLRRFCEVALGLQLEDLQPWDVAYLLRGGRYDGLFTDVRAMSLAKRTLMGLGIDLKKMANIVIDAEERPGKSAEPHCIRAEVPGKIYLVWRPQGGLADLLTLFHEVGRALQAAGVASETPFEERHLGDRAVARTMGFVFQYLVLNHEWLADYLKMDCSEELRAFIHLKKLYGLRAAAVRFLAALEYLDAERPSEEDLVDRVTARMVDVLGHPHDPVFALTGFHEPLAGADVLRGWIFEAELREILVGRFGERWYSRPAAGDFLRELWRHGQRDTVEELAARVRTSQLDLEPLQRELR